LNFGAGQTTASFTVTALTDSILESSPETVNLVLLGGNVGSTPSILTISDVPPTGTAPTGTTPSGTTPTAATTVPSYFFGATNYSVTEGSSAPITIFRSGNVTAPGAITFRTSGGSAQATGSQPDYNSVSQSISFAPGQTSAQVPVQALTDPLTDPDETVGLFLGGGILGSPSVAVLKIIDNTPVPPPTFNYGPSPGSVADLTSATFTINRTGGNTSLSTSVDYFILPFGGPVNTQDYTITGTSVTVNDISGGTVSFGPGVTSVSLTINNPPGTNFASPGYISLGFGPNTNAGPQSGLDITLI
jgi:hypothetical protein